MARLLLNPDSPYYNSAGEVLDSGTITTTATGTTTAKDTYVDADETHKNTNPIRLTTVGTVNKVGAIYGDADAQYRFVTKDKDGNTIKTVDAVESIMGLHKLEANLDVNGNSIISSSNGDITLDPGRGRIKLGAMYWPSNPGSANNRLVSDGIDSFYWAPLSIVNDTTPTAGGDWDMNGYTIKFSDGTGIQDANDNELLVFNITGSATNYIEITNAATGNNPSVVAAGSDENIDLNLVTKGTGTFDIGSLKFDMSDYGSGKRLTTNASGNISWTLPQKILQKKSTSRASTILTYTPYSYGFSDVPIDYTEGDELLSLTITPESSNSLIDVVADIPFADHTSAATLVYFIVINNTVVNVARLSLGQYHLPAAPLFGTYTNTGTDDITVSLRAVGSLIYLGQDTNGLDFGSLTRITLDVEERRP